jgi:hypothetical protein
VSGASRKEDAAQSTVPAHVRAFVEELADLYATLWHEGKLDAMVRDPDGAPESE